MSNNAAETKEIAATGSAVQATDYGATASRYLKTIGTNVSESEAMEFCEVARANGLNPFKREVYFVKFGDKRNIITGYETYIKRAEATGLLDGWKVDVTGRGNDMAATLTIYRKDWKYPFTHTAYFSEMAKNTDNWKKMPSHMLRKTAISQGFRMCFTDALGGFPYTREEMDATKDDDRAMYEAEKKAYTENEIRNITPDQQQQQQQQQQHNVIAPNASTNAASYRQQVEELFHRYGYAMEKNMNTVLEYEELKSNAAATEDDWWAFHKKITAYLSQGGINVSER